METAPTSIEVLLHPTLVQSNKPSDLRGSLSPTTLLHACPSVYSTWCVSGDHPYNYGPGPALLNFSDQANTDQLTPCSVFDKNIRTSVSSATPSHHLRLWVGVESINLEITRWPDA